MITPKEINRLISIPGYEVQGFHFDKQRSEGVLYIQIKKMNSQFDCACGYHTNRYYDREPFRVRDLPYGEWKIVYFFLKLRAHGLIRREPGTIPLYLRIKWLVSA